MEINVEREFYKIFNLKEVVNDVNGLILVIVNFDMFFIVYEE